MVDRYRPRVKHVGVRGYTHPTCNQAEPNWLWMLDHLNGTTLKWSGNNLLHDILIVATLEVLVVHDSQVGSSVSLLACTKNPHNRDLTSVLPQLAVRSGITRTSDGKWVLIKPSANQTWGVTRPLDLTDYSPDITPEILEGMIFSHYSRE